MCKKNTGKSSVGVFMTEFKCHLKVSIFGICGEHICSQVKFFRDEMHTLRATKLQVAKSPFLILRLPNFFNIGSL